MNQNRWLDMTPLLDVFLILLFAVLINRQIDQHQLENTYAAEVEGLMSQNTRLQLALDQWDRRADAEQIEADDDRIKYDFLKEKAVVIDLVLRTEVNQVWLNEAPTSIYLVDIDERRESQKNRIKQALENEFQQQSGVGVLLLVTLDADTQAYRYAYRMMQEAAAEFVRERSWPEAYLIQLH
jgi:hypothetical protein